MQARINKGAKNVAEVLVIRGLEQQAVDVATGVGPACH
jgi:hypothetical protein